MIRVEQAPVNPMSRPQYGLINTLLSKASPRPPNGGKAKL